jgi:prepilin-type N-terminal cleavage/methylation domain-containing protein
MAVTGKRRGCPGAGAFTLIEVLVVVAIIALLVAILLPSLARARTQARSTVCLSYLHQQGVAAIMYAHDARGQLPSCNWDAIERIPNSTRLLLTRMISDSAEIFYCPSNEIRPWVPKECWPVLKRDDQGRAIDSQGNLLPPEAVNKEGRIRYWWVANPDPQQAIKFVDTDDDGTTDDEYIRKAEDKAPHRYALSTDQSRQMAAGWYFIHGRGEGLPPNVTDTNGIRGSWKNTLYADGRAASVPGFKVIVRWGSSNYAGW